MTVSPHPLLHPIFEIIGYALAYAMFRRSCVRAGELLEDDQRWLIIATAAIGALLGTIAIILMVEMHSLLIGEGATKLEQAAIRAALEQTEHIERVIHLRTQYLGPDELLVGAKIALAPETDLATVAATIDAAEAAVRAAVPAAKVIYLEPDLDRALTGRA